MPHRRILLAPLLVAVLIGCGDSESGGATVARSTLPGGIPVVNSTAPSEAGRWHLVETARFALDREGQGTVGRVRDLALGRDGTLLVADVAPVTVHVYDSAGSWLRDIGREGSGPGEFEDAFLAVQGDTILVQDRRNSRLNRFLADGTSLDALPSACCMTEGIGIASDGRVVVPVPGKPEQRKQWLLVRAGGGADTLTIADLRIVPPPVWTVRVPGGQGFGKLVPFVPAVRTAFDPTAALVLGWSGEYRFRRTSNGADTTLLFGRDVQDRPLLDAAARAQLVERQATADAVSEDIPVGLLRQAYDADLLPEQPELFDMFWVDKSGRTWVQRVGSDSAAVTLDLFAADGAWLDAVSVPAGQWPTAPYFRPVAWDAQEVVVIVDGDAGPVAIRYRIERR